MDHHIWARHIKCKSCHRAQLEELTLRQQSRRRLSPDAEFPVSVPHHKLKSLKRNSQHWQENVQRMHLSGASGNCQLVQQEFLNLSAFNNFYLLTEKQIILRPFIFNIT